MNPLFTDIFINGVHDESIYELILVAKPLRGFVTATSAREILQEWRPVRSESYYYLHRMDGDNVYLVKTIDELIKARKTENTRYSSYVAASTLTQMPGSWISKVDDSDGTKASEVFRTRN